MQFFLPIPKYTAKINRDAKWLSLLDLCREAGIPCCASGAWVNRMVAREFNTEMSILVEPGDTGRVLLAMPDTGAMAALEVMAYAMHDGVAKQSILCAKRTCAL